MLLVAFAAGIVPLFAQKVYHNQTLYWLRFQNQLVFSPRVYWNNEIDNRRFIGPDVQNQLIYHSRLHYKTGKWDLAGGITWSMAYAQIPENGSRAPIAEIRPVAEATHEQSIAQNLFMQNRIRVDSRFFQEERETSIFEESELIFRLRYRLQVRFPLKRNDDNVTLIGMRIADEIMINSTENVYDQNRIYITTDFYINKSLSLEAGYLYINQQRFDRDDFFLRNVLRFSVLHRAFVR
jgi:hypothetical protein